MGGSNNYYRTNLNKKKGNLRAKSTDIKKRIQGIYKISNRELDFSGDKNQILSQMRHSGNFTE